MGARTRAAANNFTTGGVILPAGINDASVASITELENTATGGAMTLISEQTASASASIEFTTGLDSTYPIYKFEFINIHPATDNHYFQMNGSTNGGSSYGVTKTTTFFRSAHQESGVTVQLAYQPGQDQAQSSSDKILYNGLGANAEESLSGEMYLFNPSSTTFVKHFITRVQGVEASPGSFEYYAGGYFNTTSAINGIIFRMGSGNLDDGIIKLYGIKDS